MTPRHTAVPKLTGLAVAASFVLAVGPGGAATSASGVDGDAAIERARVAARREAFGGIVLLSWREGKVVHHAQVLVRNAGGVADLGRGGSTSSEAGPGAAGWVGDWTVSWGAGAPYELPRAGDKWTLTMRSGPRVAGRATTVVNVRSPDTKVVRARLYLDDATGLLLERDVFGPSGRLLRSVGFVEFEELPADQQSEAPPRERRVAPGAPRRVPDGYLAPEEPGEGYHLVGGFRRPDGVVQLLYSDGIFSMSVFEQEGAIEWDALPDGREGEVAGHRMRSYTTVAGEAVLWQRDDVAVTCIGDAPLDEMLRFTRALVEDDARGVLGDIADFVLSPFSWD